MDQAVAPHLVTEVPGPRARAHVEYDHTWSSPSLPRAYPFVPVRGHGATVEDIDGNVFVDFCAGIAVNSTGHSHPAVVGGHQGPGRRAGPLQRLGLLSADLRPRCAEAIAETAPISGSERVYLGNSGAEAVEAALKLARVATRRPAVVVAFLGGFHGRTMGAVTLTASKAKYHAGLRRRWSTASTTRPTVTRPTCAWFEEVLFDKLVPADEVAAIIVEPVQGEGGYIVPEDGFIQRPARAVRSPRHPAHRRRDPVGRRAHREDVGHRALRRRAGHPAHRQGHRLGHAARGDGRPGRDPGGLGQGRPRLHLRRQPRRLRRCHRHHRAARRTASSRTPPRVARRAWRRWRPSRPTTPSSSSTPAVWA